MALKWLSSNADTAKLYSTDVEVTSNGQTVLTWDTPYIMGIGMLEVYLNGVHLQKSTYKEVTPYSISYVDTERLLKATDIITICYRASNLSLGDILVVSDYAKLLETANPVYNEVALVIASKTFYLYGDTGWESFVIPFTSQNIGVLFQQEVIPVTDVTQLTYTLSTISYQPGMQNLLVFVDGKKVDLAAYTEVDNKTITFKTALPEGSKEIQFLSADTDSWEECFSHEVVYSYDTAGNISGEVISMNGSTVQGTTYGYDTDGNVVKETVVKGSKTIIKDYQYDTSGNIVKIIVTVVK